MRECSLPIRLAQRRRGFTLVEVLIAIIILLIGVAAAIRIFPRGFDVFTRIEQQSAGRDRVNSLNAEFSTHADYLPDGIFPVDFDINNPEALTALSTMDFRWNDISSVTIDPANPLRQYLFPANTGTWPLWEPLSARVLRRVVGERCVIPSDFNTPGGGGVHVSGIPNYLPRFGPLEVGQPISIYDLRYRKVSSNELDGLKAKSASLSDQLYYSIDYASGDVRLSNESACRVRVVYYYYRPDPANPTQWIPVPIRSIQPVVAVAGGSFNMAPPASRKIIPGSEVLHRAYEQVQVTPGDWSGVAGLASGQFCVADDAQGSLLLGALYFAKADAGRTVKLDYTVADWNILHEDVTVDGDGYIQLALTPKMRNRGNGSREPQTWGLYGPMANGSAVMVLVNTNTGAASEILVDNPSLRKPKYTFSGTAYANYVLLPDETLRTRWRIGTTGDETAGIALCGQTFRVYYRATQDWTVQFFRAPATFWFIEAAGTTPDDLKIMNLGWDAFSYTTSGGNGWIAVPGVYGGQAGASSKITQGQSVAVDYQWEDTSTGEPRLVRVTGEVHTVPPVDINRSASVFMLRHPRAVGTTISVRGISVTTRALWVQPRRGPVTIYGAGGTSATRTINERWESVDSTIILPSSEE